MGSIVHPAEKIKSLARKKIPPQSLAPVTFLDLVGRQRGRGTSIGVSLARLERWGDHLESFATLWRYQGGPS